MGAKENFITHIQIKKKSCGDNCNICIRHCLVVKGEERSSVGIIPLIKINSWPLVFFDKKIKNHKIPILKILKYYLTLN